MRKRIYSTIIAVASSMIMLVQPVCAEIPEIDYGSMSNEELITLRDTINEKIAENGGDNIIGSGVYTVGEDIKSGSYKLIANINDGSSVHASIFDSAEEYNSYKNNEGGMYSSWFILSRTSDDGGSEQTSIQLSDGQVFLIEQGSAIIEKIKASWMPDENDKKEKKSDDKASIVDDVKKKDKK